MKSEAAASRAEKNRRLDTEDKEMVLINTELINKRSARLKDLYQKLTERREAIERAHTPVIQLYRQLRKPLIMNRTSGTKYRIVSGETKLIRYC